MKKLFSFVFALAILVPGIILSAGWDGFGHSHGNPEVKKYVKERIMPVLKQKRLILETELSTAEKTEIAECRTQLKQIQQQHREFMEQKPEGVSMHEYMESSGQSGHQSHQQTREIMQRLQAIADKHSNTLDKIKTDLEPTFKQWKEDLAKLRPENAEKQSYGRHYDHEFSYGELSHHHLAAHFLLMQVDEKQTENNGALKSDMLSQPVAATASVSSFRVFPNPASSELVTGSEQIPSQNQLSVFDLNGNIVLSLQNVQPSQHIDISQLAGGSYIVELKSGNEASNSKIVISH